VTDFFSYTVKEPGRQALTGRYLATRRSDGFWYSELRVNGGKTRKFVNPSHVTDDWEPAPGEVVLIDKAHELS